MDAMTEEENVMTEKLVAMTEELVTMTHFMTSEDAWLSAMPELIETYGLEALSAWRDERNKHKHKLVHTAAARCFVVVLKAMAALGFDLNVQRDSDQCTPLHLAIFYKKPEAIAALKALGVDASLENSYGESCNAKYEKLAQSMLNIVFLDLELTHGFYDADEWRGSKILELAVVITDKDLKELGRGHWVVAGFSADELNGLALFHQARGPPPLHRLHTPLPSVTRASLRTCAEDLPGRGAGRHLSSAARRPGQRPLHRRPRLGHTQGASRAAGTMAPPPMIAPPDLGVTPRSLAAFSRQPHNNPPACSAHTRARAVRPRTTAARAAVQALRREGVPHRRLLDPVRPRGPAAGDARDLRLPQPPHHRRLELHGHDGALAARRPRRMEGGPGPRPFQLQPPRDERRRGLD